MPLPKHVAPMLCTLADRAFDDDAWIFEPKLDGLRVIVRYDGKSIEMLSRNDIPQGVAFPEIVTALQKNIKKPAILDGEVVCLDQSGWPSFKDLQQRFHQTQANVIARRVKEFPAYIYLFDVLYFDGRDVRSQPLSSRKKILRGAIRKWDDPIFFTEATQGRGIDMLDAVCQRNGEGVVAKRLDSEYIDRRSGAWLKIKCSGRQEFVIGGFTEPRNSREGFGAILVGYYDDAGKKLIYAGKVGTGFNNKMLIEMKKQFEKLEIEESPFAEGKPPRGTPVHWMQPKLVAEIGFAEWTQHGILRQPRFEGLREDKRATKVRRETAKLVATRR